MHPTTTTEENAMPSVTIRPMPANENGRGNLAGWALTCSTCGPIGTTTFASSARLDASAHERFHETRQPTLPEWLRRKNAGQLPAKELYR